MCSFINIIFIIT